MMTHCTKKPYECRYVGCDKSYCDARSLRRHLENHHQQMLEGSSTSSLCGGDVASLTPGLTPGALDGGGGQTSVFRFDHLTYPSVGGGCGGGELHEMSPISPAVGGSPTDSLGQRCPWPSGYNPLE